jgi:uncharacterized membrane protein YGL010W
MARKIEALLAEYGESHQNETNKAVHWVCVAVIVWTVMAGLYAIPQPGFMAELADVGSGRILSLLRFSVPNTRAGRWDLCGSQLLACSRR